MGTVARRIRIEPVDSVPAEARVSHYDELREAAKQYLPRIAEGEPATASVDPDVWEAFGDHDVIKFTDYYHVERVRG